MLSGLRLTDHKLIAKYTHGIIFYYFAMLRTAVLFFSYFFFRAILSVFPKPLWNIIPCLTSSRESSQGSNIRERKTSFATQCNVSMKPLFVRLLANFPLGLKDNLSRAFQGCLRQDRQRRTKATIFRHHEDITCCFVYFLLFVVRRPDSYSMPKGMRLRGAILPWISRRRSKSKLLE